MRVCALILTIALAVALLAGCGQKSIAGKWMFGVDTSAVKDEGLRKQFESNPNLKDAGMELTADGKAQTFGPGTAQKGTWKLEGNSVTITGEGGGFKGILSSDGKRIDLETPEEFASFFGEAKLFLTRE